MTFIVFFHMPDTVQDVSSVRFVKEILAIVTDKPWNPQA